MSRFNDLLTVYKKIARDEELTEKEKELVEECNKIDTENKIKEVK